MKPHVLSVVCQHRPPFLTNSRLLARAYADLMPVKSLTSQMTEGVDSPHPKSPTFGRLRTLRRTCQEWKAMSQTEEKLTTWYYTGHNEGTEGGQYLALIRRNLHALREALLEEVRAESKALASELGHSFSDVP